MPRNARTLPSVNTDGSSGSRETATTINALRAAIIEIQNRVRWLVAEDAPDGSGIGYPVTLGAGAADGASAASNEITPTANALVFVAIAGRADGPLPGSFSAADDGVAPLSWARAGSSVYDDGGGTRVALAVYVARAGSAPEEIVISGSCTGAASTAVLVGEIACPPSSDLSNTGGASSPDGTLELALDREPGDTSTVIAVDCTLGAYAVRPPLQFTNSGEIVAKGLTIGVAFSNKSTDQSFLWKASGMRATAVAFEVTGLA